MKKRKIISGLIGSFVLFIIIMNSFLISQSQDELSFDDFKKLKPEEKNYENFKLLSDENQRKFLFDKDESGKYYLDSKEKTKIFQEHLEKNEKKLRKILIEEINKRISRDSSGNIRKFKDGSVPAIRNFKIDDPSKKLVFEGSKIGIKDKNGRFSVFIDLKNIPSQTTSISFGKIKDKKGNEIGDGFILTYNTLRDKSGKELTVNIGVGAIGYDKNGKIILMDENGNSLFVPKTNNLFSEQLQSIQQDIIDLAKESKKVASDKIDELAKKRIEEAKKKARESLGGGILGEFASSFVSGAGTVVADSYTKAPKQTAAKIIDSLAGYVQGNIGVIKASADALELMFSETNELKPLNGNGVGEITITPGINNNIDVSLTKGSAIMQGNRFYSQFFSEGNPVFTSKTDEPARISLNKNGEIASSLNLELMGYRRDSERVLRLDNIIRTSRTFPTAIFFDSDSHEDYLNRIVYDGKNIIARGDGYKYIQIENNLQKVSIKNTEAGEPSIFQNGNYGLRFVGDKTYSTTANFNPSYEIGRIINENDPNRVWRTRRFDDESMILYNLNEKLDEQVTPVVSANPFWISLGNYVESSISGLTWGMLEGASYSGDSNEVIAALRFPNGRVTGEKIAEQFSRQINNRISSLSQKVGGDDSLRVLLEIGDSLISSERGQVFLERTGIEEKRYSDLMYFTRHLDEVDSIIDAIKNYGAFGKGSELQFTSYGVFVDEKPLVFYNNRGQETKIDPRVFRVLTSSLAENPMPRTTLDIRSGVDAYLTNPGRIYLNSRWRDLKK